MTAMKKNKSIETLMFDSKNILRFLIFASIAIIGATGAKCDVEGAKAIAAILTENDTLIELSLRGENHTPTSRGIQVDCLVSEGNRFGDGGATMIADALQTNTTLKLINLFCRHSLFKPAALSDALFGLLSVFSSDGHH